MRLLHTSDWHLGRTFHGRNLLGDQEQVLAAIADLVIENDVDVVLVAGDLYDRAVPSVDAVQLATRALRRIADAGAQIVVSTGNHDSAARLGAFTEFLSAGGLHIRAAVTALDEPVLLADDAGPVAIYGVPYLDPDVTRQLLDVPRARGHAGVLAEALRRIHTDLDSRSPAPARWCSRTPSSSAARSATPSVGSSCATQLPCRLPAAASDSLFDFKRGTVGSVPAGVFAGIDYVALGHLHRRQQLARHLRYSGSPLPYSFSEAGSRKGCWLVDLDGAGLAGVRPVELPVIRPLATVRGTLAEVLELDEHRESYLAVELTDVVRPLDPMRRLVERFPHAVKLDWCPPALPDTDPDFQVSRRGLPDADLLEAFLLESRGFGPSIAETALIQQSLSTVRSIDAAA